MLSKKRLLVIAFTVFLLSSFILKYEFIQEDFDDYDEHQQGRIERQHAPVSPSIGYKSLAFEGIITGNRTKELYDSNQSNDEQSVPITMSEREENTEDMLVQTVSIESNDADVITIMEDMEIVWAEGVSLRVPAGATVENGITIRMGEQGGQTIYPNDYTETYPAGYAIELVNLSGDNVSVMDTVSSSLLESSGCSISNMSIVGLILLLFLLRNEDKLHTDKHILTLYR